MPTVRVKTEDESRRETNKRLAELKEEDQGHPSLATFFWYEGYKIGSTILITIFVVVFIITLIGDGIEFLQNSFKSAEQHVNEPIITQEPHQSKPRTPENFPASPRSARQQINSIARQ